MIFSATRKSPRGHAARRWTHHTVIFCASGLLSLSMQEAKAEPAPEHGSEAETPNGRSRQLASSKSWFNAQTFSTPQSERPSLGLGMAYAPSYGGSSKYRPAPFLVYSMRKKQFFIDNRGIGADFATETGLYGSLALTYRGRDLYGRSGSPGKRVDGSRYAALNRVPGSLVVNAHLGQTFSTGTTVFVEAMVAPNLGNEYTLGVTQPLYQSAALHIGATATVNWGDARLNRTLSGITAAQHAQSGLSQYTPGSGISSYAFNLSAEHKLDKHWSVLSFAQLSVLPQRIRRSPVTSTGVSAIAGVAVRYTW